MKVDKRDLILESIIQAYLAEGAPIGSSELGTRMSANIPASTIRVYFKKLSDEGAITQLHISGGRIPTQTAMRYYWGERLNLAQTLEISDADALSFLARDAGVYCMIFGVSNLKLEGVFSVKDRFLLLDFGQESMTLRFNVKAQKFLSNLIGMSLDELEAVCAQVGLGELRSKIREFKRSRIYFQENAKVAFEMFDDERLKIALEPSFEKYFKSNLSFEPFFEPGFMGLKMPAKFEGKNAVMICAGSVYNDYEKFLNNIKEVA